MTTITYLEMRSPEDMRAPALRAGVEVRQILPPDPAVNARLYATVGAEYRWVDRLSWSEGDWRRHVARSDLETWVLAEDGADAGYFELLQHDDPGATDAASVDGAGRDARGPSVEIAYFGLLPGFIGRGLGAMLLGAAVRRAWALPTSRVWLHTSSHDHPHALANYLARGFRIYRTQVS